MMKLRTQTSSNRTMIQGLFFFGEVKKKTREHGTAPGFFSFLVLVPKDFFRQKIKENVVKKISFQGEAPWINRQRKTFTNWLNSVLADSGSDVRIVNLEAELGHGALEPVMRILAKTTVKGAGNSAKQSRVHEMDRLVQLFDAMTKEHIPLVNISPEDILDGNVGLFHKIFH